MIQLETAAGAAMRNFTGAIGEWEQIYAHEFYLFVPNTLLLQLVHQIYS